MKKPKQIQNETSKEMEELQCKFLNPAETNREDLTKLIQYAFDELPSGLEEGNPFLGKASTDYAFLRDFEDIPQYSKDRRAVFTAATSFLQGQVRWHSPSTLHNISPPPMLDSVAIMTVANLYNPNMIWDYVSAGSQEAEQQVIRQIASLVGWESKSDGCFTFGGKGCLMYAIRIGLNRCISGVSSKGLSQEKQPVVITSEYNHYIIENICAFIGLGKDSCIRVKTKEDETLDLVEFHKVLEEVIKQGRPIACIVLSGGNTLHVTVDPIKEAIQIIDDLCRQYNMIYRPYIYLDAVVGWPWLFFKNYDFNNNPLKFIDSTINKVKHATQMISAALLTDAIGIDFHKIGFCPYSTSLFVTKEPAELHSINNDSVVLQERKPFGHNFLQHYTIEHSRGAAPVLAAWVALQNAGIVGFQSYLGHLTTIAETFRENLPILDFEALNPFSVGFASVFCPLLKGKGYSYKSLLTSSCEEIDEYNQYVYKLFITLEGKNSNESKKIVMRYLPNYKQAECGSWPAVLTIYPMSLHITVEKAKELSLEIYRAKKLLDGQFVKKNKKQEIPKAIHK